jgi:hypothetical protein
MTKRSVCHGQLASTERKHSMSDFTLTSVGLLDATVRLSPVSQSYRYLGQGTRGIGLGTRKRQDSCHKSASQESKRHEMSNQGCSQ